eukprot:7384069-Prymnesium_polylepis.2
MGSQKAAQRRPRYIPDPAQPIRAYSGTVYCTHREGQEQRNKSDRVTGPDAHLLVGVNEEKDEDIQTEEGEHPTSPTIWKHCKKVFKVAVLKGRQVDGVDPHSVRGPVQKAPSKRPGYCHDGASVKCYLLVLARTHAPHAPEECNEEPGDPQRVSMAMRAVPVRWQRIGPVAELPDAKKGAIKQEV